ncbi:hypothetical protein [Roseibium alexandrii]|uniref:Uncharacterized protein n=1 Tax=Roseibium alexandrii TaxID=388408 RepID=A0A0M6ZWE2_9HYPH|nr:hypothetical protein [Roseibium alexandrii]CTQ67089.1 hypothetical protein LAX5112_01208 [Roseibium alexandrii]
MRRYSSQDNAAADTSGGTFAISSAFGPGSNGYMRRKLFVAAGAYSWTAPQTGKVKVYAIGPGGGGGQRRPGAGGGLAEIELDINAGDVLSVTVGPGGLGTIHNVDGNNGGTTTVVCAAQGLNLVANGGEGGKAAGAAGGTATGGDVNRTGGSGGAVVSPTILGGGSSGGPRGDGFEAAAEGGSGWGGPSNNGTGASSHFPGRSSTLDETAVSGLFSKGGIAFDQTYGYSDPFGQSAVWWDLDDMDGGGGALSKSMGAEGGTGAGGGGSVSFQLGGNGGFGGGGGAAQVGGNGGNGGGGGAGGSTAGGATGGRGGDGAVIIYFNPI